jgi:hypothetical protein
MAALSVSLLIFFLVIVGLLGLVYRETEQDFPPVHRCHHR